jgi:biopolymer transport protein ExbB
MSISKTATSRGAIKFAALSQGGGDKAAKLLTFSQDEQTSSWLSGGYVGVILKSLTTDGWVVIGILAIMAAISWLVMINKASYLKSIGKGNELFLKEWRHVASDLTVLDHSSSQSINTLGGRVDAEGQHAMRKAPLFRIYHLGSGELQSRLNAERSGRARGLSARSIQAIRATLDGGLVRETQKLNRLMVLLTIAISGGPFLGLLGTVIGVMITFAAIAAQGDVNVNAIAPGIAAALAATVAGLAVAIPSLFGYNYLLSRVKDTTSDMQVFIDEFVTRMAEFYESE